MAILDFHGFAMPLKCLGKKEAYAVPEPAETPFAKRRLFGTNYRTKLEMGGVSCMVVFQLAQGPKLVGMPYEPAIEGEESKAAKVLRRNICFEKCDFALKSNRISVYFYLPLLVSIRKYLNKCMNALSFKEKRSNPIKCVE
jgi:hypothetical protein